MCACVHLSSNRILSSVGESNSAVYLCLLSHGHALMTEPFCCMCVRPKKKQQRGEGVRDAGGCFGKKMYTHQRAGSHLFWVHVNMDASVVLWTKACHCCHPPHFATVQASWFLYGVCSIFV